VWLATRATGRQYPEGLKQKAAFQRYIESGNGCVGIHSATDTEYDWAWYGQLVAPISSHPSIQSALIQIEDANHPSTVALPADWQRADEWYNFRANPREVVHVLATLDESTYDGRDMGDHPIASCHEVAGGGPGTPRLGAPKPATASPSFGSICAAAS
jgi:type 1 glutamine amidotransferase